MVSKQNNTTTKFLFYIAASIALLIASLGVFTTPAHASSALTPPSTPKCPAGGIHWVQDLDLENLPPSGIPDVDVRFETGGVTIYEPFSPLPGQFSEPIVVDIHEVIVWDGYTDRPNEGEQPNERIRVIFLLNGDVVWESPWTGTDTSDDIETGLMSDEAGGRLGSAILPNGADQIIVAHWGDPTYGGGDGSSNPNSVIPYAVCVEYAGIGYDYGDAPATYGNAIHYINLGSSIGLTVDGESGSQYSAGADGDDVNGVNDNDGVTFIGGAAGVPNTTGQLSINVNNSAHVPEYLFGWIDFNGNGVFDTDEQIVNQTVPFDYDLQTFNFDYTVPADAACGQTYARFRLGTDPALGPTDISWAGEVEDYLFNIDCGSDVGSVSGVVWCESDTNANTSYDPSDGDTATEDVAVTLFADTNCDGSADGAGLMTMDTSGNGSYAFTGLAVGSTGSPICYVTQVDTTDSDLAQCNNPITDTSSAAALTEDDPSSTDNDFGFDTPMSGLGDTVWFDANNNGVQDGEEPGLAGVTVNAYDEDGNLVGTAVTGPDGEYFIGLPAGTYVVEVDTDTLPEGVSNTYDLNNPIPGSATVTLGAGEIIDTVDFGYKGSLAVGSNVWEDVNSNGQQDDGDDSGIANVIVNLYLDADNDGVISNDDPMVATQLTGSDGSYLFDCLIPGDYIVQIDEANFTPGTGVLAPFNGATVGGADPDDDPSNTDSNGSITLGSGVVSPAVTLSVGDEPLNGNTNDTVDFGFLPTGGFLAVSLSGASTTVGSVNSTALVAVMMSLALITIGVQARASKE